MDSTIEAAPRRLLVLVALVVATLKGAALFLVLPVVLADQPINAAMFPDGYDQIASHLANGSGYRMFDDTSLTMLRTPGFVLVLAGLFYAFGDALLPIQILNFVFSILTAFLVFLAARRICRSEVVAIVAAVLVFLHPGTLVSDSRGGPESMLMLFIALGMFLCALAMDTQRPRDFVLLGLAFGAMMLVKSSVALILPGVAAWAIFKRRRSGAWYGVARGFALACLVSGLCMTPWIVRNFLVSGAFVPTMTVGGLAAFQGQHVVRNLGSGKEHHVLLAEAATQQGEIANEMNLPARGYFFQQFYSVADEMSFYSELSRRTWQGYRDSPMLAARAVAYNLFAFWVQGRTSRATAANAVIALPFLVLVAVGWWQTVRQGRDPAILGIFVMCYLMPHLLILSMARYYIPILPPLSILAAVPVASILRQLKYGQPRLA